MFKGIIEENGFKRLLLIIFGIFFMVSALSAIITYKASKVSLETHFGAIHMLVTRVQESLVTDSIKINLIFFIFTLIGVTLLGILYSHRVTGPFVSVKRVAAALGAGKFDQRLHLRQKDAIHTLATSLNEIASEYQKKTDKIASHMDDFQKTLYQLESIPDDSEEREMVFKELRRLDEKIKNELGKIKL